MTTEKEAIQIMKDIRKAFKKINEQSNIEITTQEGKPIRYKSILIRLTEDNYDVFDVILKMIERR